MLRKLRSQLSYANVMATVALFMALGGGAYAAATAPRNSVTSTSIRNGQVKQQDLARRSVTNSKIRGRSVSNGKIADNAITTTKLGPNAVTTTKLADGSVTTAKLADKAVTTGKLDADAVTSDQLAANSVSGLKQIQNDSITGQDVIENSLTFGCTPLGFSAPANSSGPFQITGGGFCALVLRPSGGTTWTAATTACTGTIPDSTLANPAQIAELQASAGGSQGPLTGTTGIWTADPSAATSVWTVHVDNGGAVADFASTPIGNTSSGPVVCVYQPASKNG
jgi:hypothetical protein